MQDLASVGLAIHGNFEVVFIISKLLGGLKEANWKLFTITHVVFVQCTEANKLAGHTTVCCPLVGDIDKTDDLCKPLVKVSSKLCLKLPICLLSSRNKKRRRQLIQSGVVNLRGDPVDNVDCAIGRLDR
eukprot:15340293-Ditylum_brightwellii.AAC.1